MKHILPIVTLIALSSCTMKDRAEFLLPAAQIAWAIAEPDIRKAFPDPSQQKILDILGNAIEAGDLESLKELPLIAIEDAARAEIDKRVQQGDISPVVGRILKQRIDILFRSLRILIA